jgi:photosystem II stability/assembly factor-like uncharacterized protein
MGSTSSVDVAALASNVMVRAGGSGSRQYASLTTDFGANWNPFPTQPTGARGGGSIAVTADGKTIIWRPQGADLSVSTDYGKTWVKSNGLEQTSSSGNDYFGQGSVFVSTDKVDSNVVYLTGINSHPLEVSHDGGLSFSPAAASGLPQNSRVNLVASFDKSGDIWAQLGDSGIYHSIDFGATFTKIDSVSNADGFAVGKAAPGSSYPVLYLVGIPTGLTKHGIYRSDNNGQSWIRINDDQHQYGWIGRPLAADLHVYGRVYLGTNGRGIIVGDIAGTK